MSKVLEGLEGVVCLVDDVLVYGKDQEQHDERLRAVMERLQREGLTLNHEKCTFSQSRVKFLGHIIDQFGISPDPDKITAICQLKRPESVSEVWRFLGMANQMSKFAPHLADKTKPLRDLLNKQSQWIWEEAQQRAFEEVKSILSSSPVLAMFDPS